MSDKARKNTGDRRQERSVIDRRDQFERRREDVGSPTGFDRRRGAGRRLSDFSKAAEEGELNKEEFKKANAKMYPSWTDVLEVIRLLGYRKTMPSEIKLRQAEDWREAASADSNVRPDRYAERFSEDELLEFEDLDEAA